MRFMIVLAFAAAHCPAFATGPSYIDAQMHPVSVNDAGEVLCRTQFVENGMGAHALMLVEFGYCVIAGDSIVQFGVHVLDIFSDTDSYIAEYDKHAGIFVSRMTDTEFAAIERKYGYAFRENNAEKCRVDKRVPLDEFAGPDLRLIHQIALKGGRGIYPEDADGKECMVNFEYDFGRVIVLRNEIGFERSDTPGYTEGIHFDYPNFFGNEDIGFDSSTVTGIVFRKP